MNYKGSIRARKKEREKKRRSKEGDWQSIQPELKRPAVVGTAVPIRPRGFLAPSSLPLNPRCAEEGPGKSSKMQKEKEAARRRMRARREEEEDDEEEDEEEEEEEDEEEEGDGDSGGRDGGRGG